MTNEHLYLAVGIPVIFIATGTLALWLNLRSNMNERFSVIDHRFDDMRDLWLAELHRVEEVLDARLKHLEER